MKLEAIYQPECSVENFQVVGAAARPTFRLTFSQKSFKCMIIQPWA
jgi:hypothetical protein